MDKQEKMHLRNVLFDAVHHPIEWRPAYLDQIENLIQIWVKRDVERELKRRTEEQTNDGC